MSPFRGGIQRAAPGGVPNVIAPTASLQRPATSLRSGWALKCALPTARTVVGTHPAPAVHEQHDELPLELPEHRLSSGMSPASRCGAPDSARTRRAA